MAGPELRVADAPSRTPAPHLFGACLQPGVAGTVANSNPILCGISVHSVLSAPACSPTPHRSPVVPRSQLSPSPSTRGSHLLGCLHYTPSGQPWSRTRLVCYYWLRGCPFLNPRPEALCLLTRNKTQVLLETGYASAFPELLPLEGRDQNLHVARSWRG